MPGWCNETLDAATFEDFLDGGGHSLALGLGAWLVYGFAVTGHLIILLQFRVKISISLLKRCSFHDIKDATKNAWTNIGLTTSLVMTTIIGALIEGHEITPQGFCLNHADALHIRQIYVAFCIACLFANLNCIIYCVLNLFYWDSLSESDAIAFLNQNPQVLGETVIFMVESYIFFVGAVGTWIYGTYGVSYFSGIFLPFLATASVNLSVVWSNLDRFKPHDVKFNRNARCGSKDRLRWIQVMQAISEPKETREKREADKAEPDKSVPAISVADCEDTNESPTAQDWNTQELSVWQYESSTILTESFIRFKFDSFVSQFVPIVRTNLTKCRIRILHGFTMFHTWPSHFTAEHTGSKRWLRRCAPRSSWYV